MNFHALVGERLVSGIRTDRSHDTRNLRLSAEMQEGSVGSGGEGAKPDLATSADHRPSTWDAPVVGGSGHTVPHRVKVALENSKDFSDFRSRRPFKFLHLFAGPSDRLGSAVKAEAEKNRLEVHILSLDRQIDKNLDLSQRKTYEVLKTDVDKGEWDALHAGFPCGSFSRARHNARPGMPGPVRDGRNIYGLESNSPKQQAEADKGTLMAAQASWLYQAQVESMRSRGLPEVSTLENPPGDSDCGSAWMVPEVAKALNETNGDLIEYNTCAFQSRSNIRHYKPGVWAGRMEGIGAVNEICRCPAWVKHEPLVGKAKTEPAGAYPTELCQAVAEAIVKTWKRILNLEWWRHELEMKGNEVSQLQKLWLENEEKRCEKLRIAPPKRTSSVAFEAGDLESNKFPRTTAEQSKKSMKEEHNEMAIGGMRNPAMAVSRLSLVREVGMKIRAAWQKFVGKFPEVLETAQMYGTEECKFHPKALEAWETTLKEILNATDPPEVEKKDYEFKSPLNTSLWRAWQVASKDPDDGIARFASEGVPLGMDMEIPSSNGVFPVSLEPHRELEGEAREFAELKSLRNYISVSENQQEASIEISRCIEKGYVKRCSWSWVEQEFGKGTASRLALILKEKVGGGVKRRIILDMKRSDGNRRAAVPERLTLPRLNDIVTMLRHMWATKSSLAEDLGRIMGPEFGECQTEFYLIDLADAFCHYGVHPRELRHCVSPDEYDRDALLWRALLFGYKAAPLLMARLSAALGRLLQSLFDPRELQAQIYVDDVFLAIMGPLIHRHTCLSAALYTAAAFGVQVSLHKGEKGTRVQWIGSSIEIFEEKKKHEEAELVLGISAQMITQVSDTLKSWQGKGMISLKELKTVTGKLSWVAGILTRIRWTVSILYAVLAETEKEQRDGTEEQRAAKREDSRPKVGLLPTKRLGGVHHWLLKLFEKPEQLLIRREALVETEVTMGVITDASPKGLGAVLVQVTKRGADYQLEPVAAFETLIKPREAELLQFEFVYCGRLNTGSWGYRVEQSWSREIRQWPSQSPRSWPRAHQLWTTWQPRSHSGLKGTASASWHCTMSEARTTLKQIGFRGFMTEGPDRLPWTRSILKGLHHGEPNSSGCPRRALTRAWRTAWRNMQASLSACEKWRLPCWIGESVN